MRFHIRNRQSGQSIGIAVFLGALELDLISVNLQSDGPALQKSCREGGYALPRIEDHG